VNVAFFLLGDSPASELYVPTFQNTIFIGHVNKKTKWNKIARVFIQGEVRLKRSLSQSEGGRTGKRHV
jgi:hypothetical protein